MAMRAGACGRVRPRVRVAHHVAVNLLRSGMHIGRARHARRRRPVSMLAERHGVRSKTLQREPQNHEHAKNRSPALHRRSIALPVVRGTAGAGDAGYAAVRRLTA